MIEVNIGWIQFKDNRYADGFRLLASRFSLPVGPFVGMIVFAKVASSSDYKKQAHPIDGCPPNSEVWEEVRLRIVEIAANTTDIEDGNVAKLLIGMREEET